MESFGNLAPGWLVWLVPMALLAWKWKWVVKPVMWLYTRLMPPKRYEIAFESEPAANAEFLSYQSQDMKFRGTPLVHFFSVDLMTHDNPISIQKVWVTTVSGKQFGAWRLGSQFQEPDERVRIETQAIRRFYIRAPYNDEPDRLSAIYIQHNGLIKVFRLIGPVARIRLAIGL